MTNKQDGLIIAIILDGVGGGRRVGWEEIRAWKPEQGDLWMHLAPPITCTSPWLVQESGLKPNQNSFLCTEDGRPTILFYSKKFLLTLRGINFEDDATPGEMNYLNACVEEHRLITYRTNKVMSVQDVIKELNNGVGAKSSPEVLLRIIDQMVFRMEPQLDTLGERLYTLEDSVSLEQQHRVRTELADIRRIIIRLHLYMEPMKTVLHMLMRHREGNGEPHEEKAAMQEELEQMTGYLERLSAYREQCNVIRDELDSLVAFQMTKALYLISLISAIMLPLGLFTGLLGVNVGGIPGAEVPWAFWAVCGLLILMGLAVVWVFKRLNLIQNNNAQ